MQSHPKSTAVFSFAVLLILTAATSVCAQSRYFKNWPAGTSPREVGTRVAQNYLARQFEYQQGKRQFVIYPEVCAGYGSLTVAELTKNKQLKNQLIQKFETLWNKEGQKHVSSQAHVDYRVFGVVPLQLYMQTKDQKYLDIGRNLADQQWAKTTPDGITAEARYWIDDMYMITAIQVQAYRATKDIRYLNRASLTMATYLDRLQQPNGLFYHAPDSKFFWGRGVGWVAAGMAELLRELPKKHPNRARILQGYQKMMAALLKHQGQDGLWRQLIDNPESWVETSSTGMFTFSMITGVKNGWLDARVYGPTARKAWLGLVNRLDQDANVKDVCVGTNKGFTVQYYLDRERRVGDLHGQAPLLWSASALLR